MYRSNPRETSAHRAGDPHENIGSLLGNNAENPMNIHDSDDDESIQPTRNAIADRLRRVQHGRTNGGGQTICGRRRIQQTALSWRRAVESLFAGGDEYTIEESSYVPTSPHYDLTITVIADQNFPFPASPRSPDEMATHLQLAWNNIMHDYRYVGEFLYVERIEQVCDTPNSQGYWFIQAQAGCH
jgi:hypothetical protein